jgi:RimJ/RimL family protein N-acetyltransferase
VTSDPQTAQLSTYRFPAELRIDELWARAPEEHDVDVIAPAFADPDVGGEAGLPPFDADTLRTMMRDMLPAMRERGLLAPYVIDEDGRVLGGFSLHHLDPMRDAVEVGYWLFPDARGRGVATRTVVAFTEHAFANGILRVEAHVRVGNESSARVLERAGFTREGVRRRYLRRQDGSRHDATMFARLFDDA